MFVFGYYFFWSCVGLSILVFDKGWIVYMQDYVMVFNIKDVVRYFDLCVVIFNMFFYVQGNLVVCCQYDSFIIERWFVCYFEEVQLLVVDNQSDMGVGRLVVSYDVGQMVIVWDLFMGDEVVWFVFYENFICVVWMCNGNVVFGECFGDC